MSEVKTKQTAEEVADELGYLAASSALDDFYEGWNAALASVISTGKRFEVGDEVEIDVGIAVGDEVWMKARIQAVSMDARNYTYQPQYVRPLPKTVDLTVEEKLHDLLSHVCYPSGGRDLTLGEGQHALLVMLASGKSLDELCKEYDVPMVKVTT
jgi:hypothetical protein